MHLPGSLLSKDTGGCTPPKQESNLRKRETWDTGSTGSSTGKKQMVSMKHSEKDPVIRATQQLKGTVIQISTMCLKRQTRCRMTPQTTSPKPFNHLFHLNTKCPGEPNPDSCMYLACSNHKLMEFLLYPPPPPPPTLNSTLTPSSTKDTPFTLQWLLWSTLESWGWYKECRNRKYRSAHPLSIFLPGI